MIKDEWSNEILWRIKRIVLADTFFLSYDRNDLIAEFFNDKGKSYAMR